MRPGREDAIRVMEEEARRRAEAEREVPSEARWLGPFVYAMAGIAAAVAAAFVVNAAASGAGVPCGKHQGEAKVGCIKQAKRDAMAWPPRPSEGEVIRRIGLAHWNKALRVARCETGSNWQHFPHGTFIGGLGMFRRTYSYGQRVTGYRWPSEGATRAEQIAVAYASFPITRGWSGWGCGRA